MENLRNTQSLVAHGGAMQPTVLRKVPFQSTWNGGQQGDGDGSDQSPVTITTGKFYFGFNKKRFEI